MKPAPSGWLEFADAEFVEPTASDIRSWRASAQPRCPSCGRFATFVRYSGSIVTYEQWEVVNCKVHGEGIVQ